MSLLVLMVGSCRPSRHLTRSKANIDSLYKSWHDSASQAAEEIERRNNQAIQDAKKGSIQFRQLPCPECPTVDVSACKDDSLKALINQLQAANSQLGRLNRETRNKLEFYENGQLKSAEGDIQSAEYAAESARQLAEVEKEKRLLAVHERDSIYAELDKKTTEVERTRSGMPWYAQIGFGLLIGLLIAVVVYERRGQVFLSNKKLPK